MKVLIVLAALCSLTYGGAVIEPWQMTVKVHGFTVCTGAAISSTEVLTLASSLQGIPVDAVTVSDSQGSVYQAQSYKVHPEFNPFTGEFNVAVVTTMPWNVAALFLSTTLPKDGQNVIAYSLNIFTFAADIDITTIEEIFCDIEDLGDFGICATYSGLNPSGRILVSNQTLYGIGCTNIIDRILGKPESYISITYFLSWLHQ